MQITVNYVQGGLAVACPKCGAEENQPCRFYDRFNKNKLGLLLHSERAAAAKIKNAKQTQIESSSRDLAKELTQMEKKVIDIFSISLADCLNLPCPHCHAERLQACNFNLQQSKINKGGVKVHIERAKAAVEVVKNTQADSTISENKTDDHALNINEQIMTEFDYFSRTLLKDFEINLSFDRRLDLFKRLKKYQDQTGDCQLDPTHYQFIQAVRFFNPELLKEN